MQKLLPEVATEGVGQAPGVRRHYLRPNVLTFSILFLVFLAAVGVVAILFTSTRDEARRRPPGLGKPGFALPTKLGEEVALAPVVAGPLEVTPLLQGPGPALTFRSYCTAAGRYENVSLQVAEDFSDVYNVQASPGPLRDLFASARGRYTSKGNAPSGECRGVGPPSSNIGSGTGLSKTEPGTVLTVTVWLDTSKSVAKGSQTLTETVTGERSFIIWEDGKLYEK
jgi:hypothetical protein